MPTDHDPVLFDQFPRTKLVFKVDRRQFLSSLNTEYLAWSKKAGGGAVFTLADLGVFTDESLARIVPEIASGCKITVQDGFVYGQPAARDKPLKLIPLDSPALDVFNHFNGMTGLSDAARDLSRDTGWEADRAFAYTRGVFLWLVQAGVCLPKGY